MFNIHNCLLIEEGRDVASKESRTTGMGYYSGSSYVPGKKILHQDGSSSRDFTS
jgi:hypothetical protein